MLKTEKDSRKKQHLQALYLLKSQQAETRKQVVQMLGVHRDTVGRWLARYESQGLEGLSPIYKAKGQEPTRRGRNSKPT